MSGMAASPSGAHGVRADASPTLEAVAALVAACRLDMAVEWRAEGELETAFVATFGPAAVSRQHRLGPGERPDFMVGGIAVELKGPRHTATAVQRQLARYAAHDAVTGIVLASARAMAMPSQIAGKPVAVVNLGRAWL